MAIGEALTTVDNFVRVVKTVGELTRGKGMFVSNESYGRTEQVQFARRVWGWLRSFSKGDPTSWPTPRVCYGVETLLSSGLDLTPWEPHEWLWNML